MSTRSVRALVGLALAGLVTSSAVPLASAGERHRGGDDDTGRVVASGLDSPRHLSATSRGDLYVAEAGSGGDDCVLGHVPGEPEPVELCAGFTGAVTKVSRSGRQSRVVHGLPSLGLSETEFIGPSDAELRGGNRLMVTIGLGNPPATRDALVDEHSRGYRRMATVQEARLRDHRPARLETEADLARFETKHNPDGGALDTNPNAIARYRGGCLVAGAGGNYVARLDDERPRTVAVLPDMLTDAPPFLGLPPGTQIPFQAVPTSAVRGPDGAVYISQLTGFPFPPGASTIWRVGRSGVPRPYATGLTMVTDLAFDRHGDLYVVQISDAGFLNEPEGTPHSGSLVRVNRGSSMHETIADDLVAPFGLALHRGHAYVTTCTDCAGAGQVQRFDLDD